MLKRLHIVGCPRSGTTLLLELISNCFHITERSPFEFSIFKSFHVDRGVVISKQPTDILYVRPLLLSDESLFVVNIVRDPRAVITSIHPSIKGYFSNYRTWKECESAARRLMSHPRFLQIHYEDLVINPDAVQRTIQHSFQFLQFKHRFSEFARFAQPGKDASDALNGLRAVDAASLYKWRQHLPRVKDQLVKFPDLQRDLERYGYERDATWQAALDAVEAHHYPCRYSDEPQYFKQVEKRVRLYFKTRRYLRQRMPG